GKSFGDFLHPDWKDHFKENFPRFKAIGEILGVEFEMIKKDGSLILVSFHGKISKDKLGNFQQTHCIFHDITEKKRVEDNLRDSEEKYRQLFELESDAIFLIEKKTGKILEVNTSVTKMYGFSREKLLTMKNIDLSAEPEKTKEATQDQLNQIPVRYHQKKDGSVFPVEITASHLSWRGRECHIAAIRDISFRVKSEIARDKLKKELFQARKMESIGTLSGGIAHDFNNLLYMISGNTELALEDTPDWNPVHQNLQEIKTASLKAAGIVKQLLHFSRKTDQKLKPIGAVTVIKDSLKFLRSTIPSTIEIKTQLPGAEIPILADPIQINQIMMNLCINASHAMEETGGTLEINIETSSLDKETVNSYPDLAVADNYLKITLSDTGPGISSETINQIFDPYFTTKEFGKGSGMGLTVVQGIVKNHDGAITVNSQVGKGTDFTILFPVIDETPEITTKQTIAIPHGTETILFVDDEHVITNMMQQILEKLGYRVEAKLNPEEALDLFQSKPDSFDIVITDMTMPQMTGAKFAEKLKEIRSDIPIILCTGHSSLIDEYKAKQSGISGYVMKPVSMSKISKAIREALDR
ncbi:MAG: PAS domain S-box protein, partial [Desulfobacterales bacterium]|nr:PAS domain S-box protein [Desulfobacterales bacterium]